MDLRPFGIRREGGYKAGEDWKSRVVGPPFNINMTGPITFHVWFYALSAPVEGGGVLGACAYVCGVEIVEF